MNQSNGERDRQGEEKVAGIDFAAELRETAARRRNRSAPRPGNAERFSNPQIPRPLNGSLVSVGISEATHPEQRQAARIEKTNFTRRPGTEVVVAEPMSVDVPQVATSSAQIAEDHALALYIQEREDRRASERRNLTRRRTLPERIGHQDAHLAPLVRRISNRRTPAPFATGANISLNNPNQRMQADFVPENEASNRESSALGESLQIQEDEHLARQLQANDYLNEEDSRPRPEDRLEHQLQQMFPSSFNNVDPMSSHIRRLNDLSFGRSPMFRQNVQQPFAFDAFQMPSHGDVGDNFFRPSSLRIPRMFSADHINPGVRNFNSHFSQPFFTQNNDIDIFSQLFQPRRRNRGANQRTIDELPTRQFVVPEQKNAEENKSDDAPGTNDNQKSCCICMENFKDAENVRTLPCLHIFHTSCIDSWLVRSSTCPICKFDITRNNANAPAS